MKSLIMRLSFLLYGSSVWATMPIANLNNALRDAESGTCTVPTGLSVECTKALVADCLQISMCNGNTDCMAKRKRVDTSACEKVAPPPPDNRDGSSSQHIIDKKTVTSTQPAPPKSGGAPDPVTKPSKPQFTGKLRDDSGHDSSDLSGDVRACTKSVAQAKAACEMDQASSFPKQVNGDVYNASAGMQNVNNVVLNCSNSKSACDSVCSDALAQSEDQCDGECDPSTQRSITRLEDAKAACDRLSQNVRALSTAANTSMSNAAQTSNLNGPSTQNETATQNGIMTPQNANPLAQSQSEPLATGHSGFPPRAIDAQSNPLPDSPNGTAQFQPAAVQVGPPQTVTPIQSGGGGSVPNSNNLVTTMASIGMGPKAQSPGSPGYTTNIDQGMRAPGYSADPGKQIPESSDGTYAGVSGGTRAPASVSLDLKKYLPGGSRDPNGHIAGYHTASMGEINGKSVDMFKKISERFKLKCKFGELLGCH